MDRKFEQIRQKLGFPTDEPLEILLERVAQKAAELPDNIELAYLHAELLRQLKRHQEAQQSYQQVTQLSAVHSEQRHDKLSARLLKVNQALRVKFFAYLTMLIVSVMLVVAMAFFFQQEEKVEDDEQTELAFVKWLSERQAAQLVAILKEKAPELFFDDNRRGGLKKPIDFLSELLNPLERKQSDLLEPETDQSETGDQPAPFQCSVALTRCRHQDIPSASGDYRQDIFRMTNTYAIILQQEKNCDGIAKLIDMYTEKLTWRQEEASLKARLEDLASLCYYSKNETAKSQLHAKRVICSGHDSPRIIYAYLRLGIMAYDQSDETKLNQMLTCAEEYSEYFHKLYGNTNDAAENYIYTGAGIWSYEYDMAGYLRLSNKAKDILEELLKEGADTGGYSQFYILSTKAVLEMNLLEAYIIADQNVEFIETVESLDNNPNLSESNRILIEVLNAIRLMRQKDYKKAQQVFQSIIVKLEQTAEYICDWEWSGFIQWLNEEHSPDLVETNAQIKLVIEAMDCDLSNQSERLKKLRAVAKWLKRVQ